ncbi:precorrin-3B C(17)-methyltransferase [Pelagovum pacificum]|uniref:Precorrin-3B C(17)-methyltransferase n=1 Tax=Pelagovum pacificum TaxID=2588711 RepID=A0A5C5GIF5_9RHOB|nr:precorrin-3B C(17)-methyltransferase [Pelagovum pacificum]QQA43199.1 precorrin-3B C(17)-methyltransferase [Pelagovum pacificum]TNY33661.1 precorrin-3B C(17)-methyltransferase [Pelagovum pacificum]
MAVTPAVLVMTRSGEATGRRIADALGAPLHGRSGRVEADVFFDNALDHARDLFLAGTPIIGVMASGILIRGVAPVLSDKRSEPPVLSVSDDGSVVVPLLGGHRGANRLARQVAEALEGTAAVTTAGDNMMGLALDEPPEGWAISNAHLAKDTMAALLAGAAPQVGGDALDLAAWLAPLTDRTTDTGETVPIDVTTEPARPDVLTFHPRRYILGVGCARNCLAEELDALVTEQLAQAKLSPASLAGLCTLDLKADEPAVNALARKLNLPLRLFDATTLEAETPRLANPSDVVFAEVGCHGVAEAAALAGGGTGAMLRSEKAKTANATCAIAEVAEPIAVPHGRPRGRLSVVGIGPGQASWRTPEVSRFVSQAEELVGYSLYIDLLGPLAAGKKRSDFPLGSEEARCRYALERAGEGRDVALVCSGDAGIYAMGALVFELLDRDPDAGGVSDAARRAEVICSPGVSALQGAAARAGAPLGHDFCAISLSDLLTPREDIVRRLKAAAEGDFVIAFYNPVSMRRRTLLAEARDILLQHRPADTPVMLASNLGRPEEELRYRRLDALEVDEVDMLTVVLVGSSQSRLAQLGEGPRMFTPRGYARRIDGDLAEG